MNKQLLENISTEYMIKIYINQEIPNKISRKLKIKYNDQFINDYIFSFKYINKYLNIIDIYVNDNNISKYKLNYITFKNIYLCLIDKISKTRDNKNKEQESEILYIKNKYEIILYYIILINPSCLEYTVQLFNDYLEKIFNSESILNDE